MPKLTPQFLVTFETEMRGIVTENWQRVASRLMWDSVMKVRPASTKTTILTWLLETAKLYPEGIGGNKRFDDLVAASFSLDIDDYGAGLQLSKNEIEDNQMKSMPGTPVAALDYAAKWSRDVGAASAYHPQAQLFNLIKNGTTGLCYDGLPFFSKVHTVNPNGGGGTYSNIVENVPIKITPSGGQNEQDVRLLARRNLGIALSQVRKQRFYNGVPRFLEPSVILCSSDLADEANFLVGAGIISQNTNTIKKLEVQVCPELDDDPLPFYIGVEDMMADEMGAFIYSERQGFGVQMYGPQTDAVLNRMKMLEWHMDGRNTAVYGHPYMFYKCFPAAAY